MPKWPIWVWLSLGLTAALSLVSIAGRHQAEMSNRAVGLMLEWETIEQIALASGKSEGEVLENLKERGLVGVALTEETVGDLPDAPVTSIGLLDLTNDLRFTRLSEFSKAHGMTTFEQFPWDKLDGLPVGLNPEVANTIKGADLKLIARHANIAASGPEVINFTLKNSADLGADAYLIAGDQALGNRELLEETAKAIEENNLHYLSPEFVSLGGDSFLRKELADRTLRIHSIQTLEAERMSKNAFNERMVKAFRERSVRWLLIRPSTKMSEDALKQMGHTLVDLRSAIRKAGGEVKEPRPFEIPKTNAVLVVLTCLTLVPALAFLALDIFGKKIGSALSVLGVLLAATAYVDSSFYTLLAAISTPALAGLFLLQQDKPKLQHFLIASAISLVGGLLVAGTMVGTDYTLRNELFRGVNLSLIAPIFLVGYFGIRQFGTIGEISKKPVTWAAAMLAIVGLAALMMIALRSGNDNPAAVSGLELRFRSMMDSAFFVRPRLKEVFFGHPLLVIGIMMRLRYVNWKAWSTVLIVAGMVGQTSIVNTLCHLHTPVYLSLARIGIGVLLGGTIGVIGWLALDRWLLRKGSEGMNG